MNDKKTILTEQQEYWSISIEGMEVTRCCVDYAFTLDFLESNEFDLTIRIGQKFSIWVGNEEYVFNPEENPSKLGLALSILHKILVSARAYKNGKLELKFTDQSNLIVQANPKYEAWEIAGKEGLLIVCTPGGDLAIWPPQTNV